MMQLLLSARHAKTATTGRPRKDEPVVTQKDAAEAAGVSVSTIQRRLKPKPETRSNDVVSDPFGHAITPAALPYWNRRKEVTALVKLAKQLAGKIKNLSHDDPMWRRLNLQTLEVKAKAIAHDFNESMPYCLCPTCLGEDPENCRLCDGRGLVTQTLYERGVPKGVRESHEGKDL
jgi:hypothetical protein